ncbi:major facilitator superfamily domain-containing protein [Aspergillus pseudodeflectus]|uniref:Major facilitator superfamily domain-containing protein n=1 Tax=Aspergillus pseudodeflectus TaxID=176178 RepID=A0ABR4L403_9EURO
MGDSKTPEIQTLRWDDPQQTKNPKNWPFARRIAHTLPPVVNAFVIAFASAVVEPVIPALIDNFHVSETIATLSLTLYTLGIGIGPVFLAPLSEILGRKWTLVTTLAFLLAFTAGAGAADNFASFLVCRALAGFLGSAGIAVGGGTMTDIWGVGKEGSLASLGFILTSFLGPTFGPIVGVYVVADRGGDWRWSMWIILLLGAPAFIALLFTSETYKAKILNEHKGDMSPVRFAKSVVSFACVRVTKMLFTEVIVFSLTLYSSYAYAMVFSFFGSFPYVLETVYGFNEKHARLALLSPIIGYFCAAVIFMVLHATVYKRATKVAGGMAAPEHRLYIGMVGSVFLPAGLFWYAWEAHSGGHWAALVASGIFLGIGAFAILLSSIIYMVDVYRSGSVASALAANGLVRYIFGAVFPLFTIQMYQNLDVHWASSVFAFLSLVQLPIPWLLFKFGPRLREKSNF